MDNINFNFLKIKFKLKKLIKINYYFINMNNKILKMYESKYSISNKQELKNLKELNKNIKKINNNKNLLSILYDILNSIDIDLNNDNYKYNKNDYKLKLAKIFVIQEYLISLFFEFNIIISNISEVKMQDFMEEQDIKILLSISDNKTVNYYIDDMKKNKKDYNFF